MRPLAAVCAVLAVLATACGSGEGSADPAAASSTSATGITGGATAVSTPGLPVQYTGADGLATTVTDVSRIVALSGDMTEIIFALGLGPNVVAADLSSVYPPEETFPIPKVGIEFRLVAELILDFEPTLVIGDEDARPLEAIEQVRSADVPVVILPRFEGITAPPIKIREVARILGVEDRGEELAQQVQDEIDAAIALAATGQARPRVAVVLLSTSDKFLMLGENTVMTGLLDAVGAEDVSPPAGSVAYVAMTPEALAAGDPEYIVTGERGLGRYVDGLPGFLEIPGVAQTSAGREGRILVYEDLYLLGLGPRTGSLLHDLIDDLHPDLAGSS